MVWISVRCQRCKQHWRTLSPATSDSCQTLMEAFEQSASTFASRPAIVTETWQPIYQALNHCANRLAHALVGRGGNPGDRVAVLMNHDAPMLAATLASSSGIPAM